MARHFNELGHFAHAAWAGGKPKIDERNLALQIGVANGLVVQIGKLEAGRGLAGLAGEREGGKRDDGDGGKGGDEFFHDDAISC